MIARRTTYTVACWAVAFAASLLAAAMPATASEDSERFYSKGLVEFHAERYAEALALFEEASAADPGDAYALYYRGVTRARLQDFAGAEADLRAALARHPDMEQGALELGVVLVKSERYEEALPWLEKGQQRPGSFAEASFFIGLAQLRLGRIEEARQSFERASHDSALNATARYYSGVAAYQARDLKEAERHFSYVISKSPESETGKEAVEFLRKLSAAEEPRWHAYGEVGFQYDTNLALLPSDDGVQDALGASNKADGRAIITAGGNYIPWRTKDTRLRIGYEIYQSLHFTENEFDLQDHRPSVEITHNLGVASLGFRARYDYYLRETDSFLQSVHTTPWVIVPEGNFGRTEIFYRMRWRGFYPEPFETLRDAWNHSAGARQLFYLGAPERFLFLGYRFDREDPLHSAGNEFAYDGQEIGVGGGWVSPDNFAVELGYDYRYENYPTSRHDNEHRLVFAFEKFLGKHFSVVAGYFGAFNDSNDKRFTYDRNIGSLTVRVRY
jgi:tetratricopeptide (TPR) repeat protein